MEGYPYRNNRIVVCPLIQLMVNLRGTPARPILAAPRIKNAFPRLTTPAVDNASLEVTCAVDSKTPYF
jgi:hypothetical protein